MMIVFFSIAAIFVGLFGYSIEWMCDMCEKGGVVGTLMILLFPLGYVVAIFVGLYKAVTEFFAELAMQQVNEFLEATIMGCFSLWA
jgi:hypothetical protein